jgi:hypothetical protein
MRYKIDTVHIDTLSGKTRIMFERHYETSTYYPGKHSCRRIECLIGRGSLYDESTQITEQGIVLTYAANL